MQKMTFRLSDDLLRLAHENHDHCISCNYHFKDGDGTHLGYNDKNELLYVCTTCSNQLVETAVRFLYIPNPFETPESTCVLWRYMDFPAYLSMLSKSALYFSNAEALTDKFEGAKGIIANKEKWDNHYYTFFTRVITQNSIENNLNQTPEQIEKEAIRLLNDLNKSGERDRKQKFVSCWHENQHESEAMWRLYSSYLSNAIAIKTNFQSLYESLGKKHTIKIGRIKYIDYTNDFTGVNDSFWRKRKSFEHEKEVRALIHDSNCSENGQNISCNLNILIHEVILSPSAEDWFIELVKDISSKYALSANIKKSNLNEQPFY
ncbi:hypothetical protein JWG40_12230 [Leptospira sp. 201903074]|uniref:hypothetical protein n=1 Tax=Leptospira abararensis TaxID=2810036 RepID=UPI0019668083|nr:hypothetical protein [Leptospira abararensis]MBM9547791.1 hypothetical protein [Leptospira abararensis]